MRESYDLDIGKQVVRVRQLSTEDAANATDVLLSVVGEPALKAVFAVLQGSGTLEERMSAFPVDSLKFAWPASDAGLARVRALYMASATVKSGTGPDGKELWLPLVNCTEAVFDGHPGYKMRFDALCTVVNFSNFFRDALEGGFTIRKV